MRRAPLVLGLALLGILVAATGTAGATEPEWHSETPVVAGIGVPAPLGEVGDIEFEAPNRGVLITSGSTGMPAGVYAYDGTGWHLYSTVCGGHAGRIAWSGPDEFWTVSDYANTQEGNQTPTLEQGRTLCRFANGEVVASYAQPLGSATTYRQMKAAACDGPSNCWFAGEELPTGAPNSGPFHLQWNGAGLTAIPSQVEAQGQVDDPPGTITGLAFFQGRLFETADTAPFLRSVNVAAPGVFAAVTTPAGATGPFVLAGDPGQLWAVATDGRSVLRSIAGGSFEKVAFAQTVEEGLDPVTAAASEPNGAGVWVAGSAATAAGSAATVTRIGSGGEVSPTVTLPTEAEQLDGKGGAARIACPTAGQCWMVTTKGWLFHLGGALPQDTDPAMHKLITFRPADESTRIFVPPGLPEDNSGEREASRGSSEEQLEPFPENRRRPSVVYDVHQKILGKRVLELSFKLRGRAHVQLLAKFHRKVVAKTPRLTLGKGPHKLHLKLDPKRWPTGLDFEVHAIEKKKK